MMTPRFSFRPLALLLGVFAGTMLAGCSWISTDALLGARYYETRGVPMEPKPAHQACRKALEEIGFAWDEGSPATGHLVMLSRVQSGDAAQRARQRRVELEVTPAGEGASFVRVGFWEITAEPGAGSTTPSSGRLLRGGALYTVFWKHLNEITGPAGATSPQSTTAAAASP